MLNTVPSSSWHSSRIVRVTHLVRYQGYFVYALDINLGDKLHGLQGENCKIGRLDITSLESIRDFKQSIGAAKVDVLLNIAGNFPPLITDP